MRKISLAKKTFVSKSIIFLLISLFLHDAHAVTLVNRQKTPSSHVAIKNILGKLTIKEFQNRLRQFVACCRPSRYPGTAGHGNVASYLVNTIKSIDSTGKGALTVDEFAPNIEKAVQLYEGDFQREIEGKYKKTDPLYIKWRRFTDNMTATVKNLKDVKGKNIIWEKLGTTKPEEVLVVGAHYDTMAHDEKAMVITPRVDMPGADDNASAVAVALSIIEFFSEVDTPRTIRVVLFDFEELAFLGSYAYVQKYKDELNKKEFAGYLNLEMLGHDSKKHDKEKKFGNMRAYIRKKTEEGHTLDSNFAKLLIGHGKKVNTNVRFELVANGFNSSDHINFWEAGFPAVTFTQNWENDFNPRNHTSNDFLETVNIRTLYASTRYLIGATLAWAFGISQ